MVEQKNTVVALLMQKHPQSRVLVKKDEVDYRLLSKQLGVKQNQCEARPQPQKIQQLRSVPQQRMPIQQPKSMSFNVSKRVVTK